MFLSLLFLATDERQLVNAFNPDLVETKIGIPALSRLVVPDETPRPFVVDGTPVREIHDIELSPFVRTAPRVNPYGSRSCARYRYDNA